MTSENLEKIFQSAKKLVLAAEEKTSLRARLLAFMKLKPVRTADKPRQTYWSNFFVFISRMGKKPMPIILSIVVLLTAGTSAAAEQSLPGDFLYPVKIEFNEQLRAAANLTAEAKASWEIRRTERRLEEAEKLSNENKLNAEVSAQIRENFEAQADRVQERIAEFEARDDFNARADLSARFETSLRAHENVLQKIATTTTEQTSLKDQIDELRLKVKARADEETRNRIKLQIELRNQANESVKAAAEARMKSAQQKIQGVRQEIASANMSQEIRTRAQNKLDLAAKLFEEGAQKLGEGEYAEAFRLFSASHLAAEEAKVMIELNARLKVNVEFENHEEFEAEPESHDQQGPSQEQEPEGKVRGKSKVELELKI